jgi:hypothetical protein
MFLQMFRLRQACTKCMFRSGTDDMDELECHSTFIFLHLDGPVVAQERKS